ncbi:prophage regulatory protein [Bradyrhizobium sp. CIR48]|uniref:helix-turn-helix transcriptional regulator n=1 Tax=Bradyrhizobium sp. CIR48 TaxID=2663840 RepID=UPI001606D0E7|nr:AlpA family transcriptional regulator [Bradyrhizobium sp. CIR48]MBB4422314.1 prophage regulatory protein [Bradyrhizobium sp. CIR48]
MQKFIRLREVSEAVGKSKTSIYRDIGKGRFPKPVAIGDQAVAWVAEEIREWQEARIAARAAKGA